MNLRKVMKVLIFFIISISIVFFLKFNYESNNYRELIIDEIANCQLENSQIDLKFLGIDEKNNLQISEEYLAVAYYRLQNEESTAAIELLKEAVGYFSYNTDFKVKYLTLDLLINELFKEGSIEEALSYALEIKNFSYRELNKDADKVKSLLNLLINENGGREVIIDILETILQDSQRLKEEAKSSYANSLGMLWAMSGEYSKGVEILLESIGKLEGGNYSLFQLKSIVEIGNVYSSLGQMEIAEKVYRKVIKLNLNNEKIINYIMVYSYVNLYEMLIYQEKYEEFFEIADEIDKYNEDMDKVSFRSSIRIRDISLAHAYISMGDPEKGYEMLKGITNHEKSTYVDDDIYTNIVWGDYYYNIADYKESFAIYENTYIEKEGMLSSKYEEMILERMIQTAIALGDKDSELKYCNILSDKYEASIKKMSKDYITYVVKKYNSEKKLDEVIIEKIKIIGMTVVIVIISLVIASKLKRAIRKSNLDEVSMVYNRKYFEYLFEKKFVKKKDFILIMYDIDDFKRVNDTYGHAFGDEVIKSIAKVTEKCIENKGKVFRYGGEEFIVILDLNAEKEALIIAENIRQKVQEIRWDNDISITISLGIARKMDTKEVTFEKADNNLYVSKKSGKNKVTY